MFLKYIFNKKVVLYITNKVVDLEITHNKRIMTLTDVLPTNF